MAQQAKLSATPRDVLGKKVKKLRRSGLIPGVVYGPVVDVPQSVSVDEHDFTRLYRQTGTTSLVDLSVDGATHTVFVREVQYDPLGKHLLHIDFYAPNLRQALVANIPLSIVGQLAGTVAGVLTHGRSEVEVRALPANMPQQIVVDISGLNDQNDSILVGDLPIPADCELVTSADELVVKLERPQLAATDLEPTAEEELAEETGDLPSELDESSEPTEPAKEEG